MPASSEIRPPKTSQGYATTSPASAAPDSKRSKEGTQATLVDLLTFEAESSLAPNADVEEVCNYLEALAYARGQLADPKGLPLSMRLLNETHRRLMRGVRGAERVPGEIRRTQNWIGGTRPGNAVYVPPPPRLLADVLSAFEKYMHAKDSTLPLLVRAGLLHVQFETIHPYLDGNGRIGRLLITLLLEHWNVLPTPLLYLSPQIACACCSTTPSLLPPLASSSCFLATPS